MSKRFTDTEVWSKPWFMALALAEKLVWFYIKDRCDNVGVWTPNFPLAEFVLGSAIDWTTFRDKCHDNIVVLDNGKWWLIDFCSFQHPDLKEASTSKPIVSYIRALKKHDLWDYELHRPKGMDTVYKGYKEQERVKVREEEKEQESAELREWLDGKASNGDASHGKT